MFTNFIINFGKRATRKIGQNTVPFRTQFFVKRYVKCLLLIKHTIGPNSPNKKQDFINDLLALNKSKLADYV